MSQYGILDTTAGNLVQGKVFATRGLAQQWLLANFPSLVDTENNRGHYLGGQRQSLQVLTHPFRVVRLGETEK
ncbi:hypothetical protein WJM93_16050 [Lactiplantibacillus plantarum]|uniref:hypothetical protein n=1 Tax=Lactiplantibacillus plantarum TaxID=1590 RepID=UPI000CD33013|nr:hypothetical protein [Lactiplantibacillus plantarum]AUV74182.1 hypothetical protein C1940_17170 [Lactiplantibacillus plantarum subsp. plantarum]MCT3206436.1 hypothetical protein [Lactiplantibacillus plantarum]MCT3220210.1 hypothetical protein [Lactiplantibacillus plantarum]MCT3267884.1 hypothetical protein [Lactiplantibacillus plantarum]MCT3281514.1 hypothetical protein [Lactiplantibacillus plantarum]